MGKKAVTAETTPLNTRVPDSILVELDELALALGRSKSDIVKSALRQFIDSHHTLLLFKDMSKALQRVATAEDINLEVLQELQGIASALNFLGASVER